MSMFGDGRNHMNYMYDYLDEFFKEYNGTLEEFFEVLHWYFKDFKLEEDN